MNQKAQLARTEGLGLSTGAKRILVFLTETDRAKTKFSLVEIQEGVTVMFGEHYDLRRLELYVGALANNQLGQEFLGRPLQYAPTDLGRITAKGLRGLIGKQNPSVSPLTPQPAAEPVSSTRTIRKPSLMILKHLGHRIAQIGN